MKKIPVLIASVALISFMSSCNTDKKETTEVTTDTMAMSAPAPVTEVAKQSVTEGRSTTITVDRVPSNVSASFTTKYPKASNVQWVEYYPVESDYLVMDSTYYYVRFNDNGTDYITWYDNRGEWVKTSTKVPGNSNLPDAVNKTINEQYPGYTIEEISKENDKNMEMFEIKLNKGEEKAKVKILPNGEIFKRK